MSPFVRVLLVALVLVLAGQTYVLVVLDRRVEATSDQLGQARDQLELLAAEMTRYRIEQSAEGQGIHALVEKIATYGPILPDSRTPQPDYDAKLKEMQAVLRAVGSLGKDAWQPILTRMESLDPQQDYDELKWLLEAAVRADPEAGKQLVAEVLLGHELPSPRLRWRAADILLRIDKPMAQHTLRRVLRTESSRGLDPDRAAATGAGALDPQAVASRGFSNFVIHYLRSDDPETEEVLLEVLSKTESDAMTLQETIEALGRLKSERAVKRIERLYHKPPGLQLNPLFLNKCLDALVAIRGEDARPFLEDELASVSNDQVARHIQHLLSQLEPR